MSDEKQTIHLGYKKTTIAAKKATKRGETDTPETVKMVSMGPGWSGRAVRIRVLSQTEVAAIRANAARGLDQDATNMQLTDAILQEGVDKMVVEYTDPVKPEKLHEAKWHPYQITDVELGKSPFKTKDLALLRNVYLKLHDVSGQEVEDIMGGMFPSVD